MSRVLRTIAPVALLLWMTVSCATAPKAPVVRDRFPLDPREGLPGPFPPGVEEGWQALLAGNAAKAKAEFNGAESRAPGEAARIGLIEAEVLGADLPEAIAACRNALAALEVTAPLLTACGEAHARSGQALDAWYLYRQALTKAPGRPALERRSEELRVQAGEELRRQAQESAGRKEWDVARQAIALAIQVDPGWARARESAGDIELEAGDRPAALKRYEEALDLEPHDLTLQEKIAALALELHDYAAAIPVLNELAALDPKYVELAEKARLTFRLANWPPAERAAARSTRLTRGEAAVLTWWMVPEVRDARVTSSEIASDVVGREDSREILRTVALGLLDVDRETHRASPDLPLSFSACAQLYLRLVALLAPPGHPPVCLSGRREQVVSGGEAIRLARLCGIIGDGDGPPITGAAFLEALDRVRTLAAPGENGPGDQERKPQ